MADGKDKFRQTNLEFAQKAVALLGLIADHRNSRFITDADRVFLDDQYAKLATYSGKEVVSERQVNRLIAIKQALVRGGELREGDQ